MPPIEWLRNATGNPHVEEALDQLMEHAILTHDPDTNHFFIHTHFADNPPSSANIVTGIMNTLKRLPHQPSHRKILTFLATHILDQDHTPMAQAYIAANHPLVPDDTKQMLRHAIDTKVYQVSQKGFPSIKSTEDTRQNTESINKSVSVNASNPQRNAAHVALNAAASRTHLADAKNVHDPRTQPVDTTLLKSTLHAKEQDLESLPPSFTRDPEGTVVFHDLPIAVERLARLIESGSKCNGTNKLQRREAILHRLQDGNDPLDPTEIVDAILILTSLEYHHEPAIEKIHQQARKYPDAISPTFGHNGRLIDRLQQTLRLFEQQRRP